MEEARKCVNIVLKREALLDDIKNRAYVIFDTQESLGVHQRHQVADIAEEGNVDILTRYMNLAVKECENVLYKYTKEPISENFYLDDTYGKPKEYSLVMRVPLEFAKVSVELLKNLLHEFIVTYALLEWLMLLGVGGNVVNGQAEKLVTIQNKIMNTREGSGKGVRRTPRPF